MSRQIGAIAAGHQRTAQAGARALAEGGNAVDAAVAAVFTACTCEPTLTGVGGGGFATVHLAEGREDVVYDFFAVVPGIERTVDLPGGPTPVEVLFGNTPQTFHVGPMSCAVPGFVAGVLEMHERHGRLSRAQVLAPGIELAREGLDLTEAQAYCHHILKNILVRRPASERIFAPGGTMLVEGDHFAQPELATTLEALVADGARSFYEGDIAREIARWADDEGGLITRADLAAYRVQRHAPVESTYRNLRFLSVPPPSSGGALVAFALRLLDEVAEGPLDLDTPDGALHLVAASIAANEIRGSEFDRHLYEGDVVAWLDSAEALERGRASFAAALQGTAADSGHPSSKLGSTTHLSVIDAEGNAVAMTTSTGCGSGEFVTATGIHLNNMMGEEDLLPVEHSLVPGQRLTSMMAPSLVLIDGAPRLGTGSAGSNRLRSAILQTLLRALERRPDEHRTLQRRLADATSRPRLHAEAGLVHAEPEYDPAVLAALRAAGHSLNEWPMRNLFFGGVNMVAVNDDGTFAAAADPRRGGGVALAMADGSVTTP